ncbi:hypothetical protein PENTCL1PPCAC_19457, partial [Pristionchus entomophagus]
SYPTTARGYIDHLQIYHQTTLKSHEIYLVCSCGEEVRSNRICPSHIKTCIGLQFTLQKLAKTVPTTPQCIQCEAKSDVYFSKAYPTTAFGYAKHLHRHHKSTLKTNGIYLVCSCGDEIRSNTSNPDHYKK